MAVPHVKRAGDPTRLTVAWWDGAEPVIGDGLQTRTGRRYLILGIRRKRDGAIGALDCMVLAKDEQINGRVFEWTWKKRNRSTGR